MTAIERDAFLYFEPAPTDPEAQQFAQCGTCRDWTGTGCRIFSSAVPVAAGDSCGLYVRGVPDFASSGKERASVTPAGAGFRTSTQVRCQNCIFYHGDPHPGGRGSCGLFVGLSAGLFGGRLGTFKLDPKVAALGCCNAWTPR